jgi:uncharacterized protein YndB with AHSA1/START domain
VTSSTSLSVIARQRYDAPPDLVFRAFTEPDLLTRWFSPSADIAIDVLAHELCPDGRYRFRYSEPSGQVSVVTGRFREIVRPTRLVFTWAWESPDTHGGAETLVTVDIRPDGGGTLVVVTHEGFPDQSMRDRHEGGWRATLARCPQVLP